MKEPFSRDDTPCVAADASLLAEQVAYYRARAGEYDAWWSRTGRYDRGAEFNARLARRTSRTSRAPLARLARGARGRRRALELACGTGLFTRHLAPCGRSRDGDRRVARSHRDQSRARREQVANVDYVAGGSVRVAAVARATTACS